MRVLSIHARFRLCACVLAVSAVLGGCRAPFHNSKSATVHRELISRTGGELGTGRGLSGGTIPPSVLIEDGISEDEAIAAALWNNAALHELLAQLGVSKAQLYNAGLITDPQLVLFLPVGPKQLEFTAYQAIDAVWLRPVRQRAAKLDLCELAQQMIQNGLNTARDVRTAHANLLLAQEREDLSARALELRKSIALLAEKRLEAGDISELEAMATRIDTLQAEALAAITIQDVQLAQEQLRVLMGVAIPTDQLVATGGDVVDFELDDTESLVATAHAMRPDLRAIEIRKGAALQRSVLARKQFMSLDGIFDLNSDGKKGVESGPGFRFTLPIFNGNKGGIAIADALVVQVDRQYSTLRDQVELDVRTAVTRLDQAREQRQLINDRVLPALAEAENLSRRNYEDGGVPYFLVLQTTTQYVDAQLRLAAANAALRTARADLERSVGRRIGPSLAVLPSESLIPDITSSSDAGSEL